MKRISLVLLGLCLFGLLVAVASDSPPDSAPAHLMEKKLRYSQAILGGVVKADFDRVSTNADHLLELAKSQWTDIEVPEYRAHLKDFWVVVEGLKSSAEEKNADGVTLAYVQMTLSCAQCHKYLRNTVK